jgi:hypothetical protein
MADRNRRTPRDQRQDKADGRKPLPYNRWLLMVYMKVDAPNLEGPLEMDLEELQKPLQAAPIGDRRKVRVLVQVDYPSGVSKRFLVTADEVIPRGGHRHESGADPDWTVEGFVRWARKRNPKVEKSALVVWGHAAGIADSMEVPLAAGETRLFASSADDGGKNKKFTPFLEILGLLRDVAPAGALDAWLDVLKAWLQPEGVGNEIQAISTIRPPLDIIGFDSCFMASVEIAYQLRGSARLLLAPQAAIGLEGWHYDLLVDHILHNRRVTSRKAPAPDNALELGLAAVRQVGLRTSSPQSLSLFCLKSMEPLIVALRRLFLALASAMSHPKAESGLRYEVHAAFHATMWAGARQFLDVADLCRQLAGRIPEPRIRAAAAQALSALKDGKPEVKGGPKIPFLVDQLTSLGVPLGGISIYNPWPRATGTQVAQGVRNVEIEIFRYLFHPFVTATCYQGLLAHPNNFVGAERRWIRREVRDGMAEAAAEARAIALGRTNEDPKPAGRTNEDPKPAGRTNEDPKPAGRGDEGGRTRYGY